METTIHFTKKGERGKKVCQGCGVSVGVRTGKCVCGFDFKNKVPVPKVESIIPSVNKVELPTQEKVAYFTRPLTDKNNNKSITLVPNGIAPFPLEDFSENGIIAWGRKVIQRVYETNRINGLLSVKGLIHWTTYCYNSASIENRNQRNLIEKTLNNLVIQINNENASSSLI